MEVQKKNYTQEILYKCKCNPRMETNEIPIFEYSKVNILLFKFKNK